MLLLGSDNLYCSLIRLKFEAFEDCVVFSSGPIGIFIRNHQASMAPVFVPTILGPNVWTIMLYDSNLKRSHRV